MTTQYNVNIVGNLVNNGGVLSGFSSYDYATITTPITFGTTWEINARIHTGNDVSGLQIILCPNIDQEGVRIEFTNGVWGLLCGYNGTWINTNDYQGGTVSANTTYWLKAMCNGAGNYSLKVSTDGVTYTTAVSYYGSYDVTSNFTSYIIGIYSDFSQGIYGGSIDLKECNIKSNNSLVWRGSSIIYNFQADSTGSYTIIDDILSSPQENINFKSNVLFPALYAYGLDEEIVTFETSIKGQANNPQGLNCFWIGSENLPTQDEFHDSYGFFRIWDNKMQVGLPCMAYGTAQYQVFDSSTITIPDSEFIDLQWKIYRNANTLYADFNYKSPNSTTWNSAGTSTIDNYNYSLGGYLNALLFVRANNTEYVPYTDLTKTRILANGLTIWQAIANDVSQSGIHIQLRHDTAANWTSVNPVLLEGEVGIETDTRKQKFGDGSTAWNSLPYDVGSTALQSIASADVTGALGYTPVNKAGDTMTGKLTVSSGGISINGGGLSVNGGNLNTKAGVDVWMNEVSKGTTPISSRYAAFRFNDTDDTHTTWQSCRLGVVECQVLNTGENRMIMTAYKNEADATWGATMTLGITSTGTAWCLFPNTTRCDGQWVNCSVQLTTTTAIGDYQIDLTNYLPNDGYKYEIMLSGLVYNSTSTYTNVYLNNAHGSYGEHYVARVGTNSRMACIDCTLPVDSGRSIYMKITDHAVTWETHDGWTGLYLVGYRRIGENS